MNNPWLDFPLADYEGHMALPGIEQAQLLSDIFADVLAKFSPRLPLSLAALAETDLTEFRPLSHE